jgi:hypothetical protein
VSSMKKALQVKRDTHVKLTAEVEKHQYVN